MRGASQGNEPKSRTTTTLSGARSLFHPAFAGTVQLLTIPRPSADDETATGQTIAAMAALVRRDSQAPCVRRATAAAIAGSRDPREAAAGIHRWIRRNVRFVQDATLAGFDPRPEEAEVLVRPIDLLRMPEPEGDCDDFSMLAAAMLQAAGIPAAFKTVAADSGAPEYSHVYVLAILPAGPVPLDASHGPYLGWEAQATGKSRVWPIEEPMRNQLRGLGFDWSGFETVVTAGMNDASKILGTRYAVPQLNPGQYLQQGNSVMYQAPAGSSAALGFPLATTGGNLTWLYLAGGAVLVMLLARGR